MRQRFPSICGSALGQSGKTMVPLTSTIAKSLHEQPVVLPHISHFMHVLLRTSVQFEQPFTSRVPSQPTTQVHWITPYVKPRTACDRPVEALASQLCVRAQQFRARWQPSPTNPSRRPDLALGAIPWHCSNRAAPSASAATTILVDRKVSHTPVGGMATDSALPEKRRIRLSTV